MINLVLTIVVALAAYEVGKYGLKAVFAMVKSLFTKKQVTKAGATVVPTPPSA